jgi:hypothetical protein
MINEPSRMSWIALVALVLVVGCTSANPRSCADGTCTDPAFPFCDIDGAFGPNIETCVAVACTPGVVDACRGDQAITCNAAGTNYDLVKCGLECDLAVGGCRVCVGNDQCGDSSPICDLAANSCRGCSTDDECPSRVCDLDSGECVPDTEIAYAEPNGGDGAPCTLEMPCSLSHAITIASSTPTRSIVRLLPGLYGTPIQVSSAKVTLIGPGATHQATSGTKSISVGPLGDVSIRGLTLDVDFGLSCDGSPSAATLNLRDLTITASQNVSAVTCNMNMRNVAVTLEAQSIVSVGSRALFDVERTRFTSPTTPRTLTASGTQMTVRVVNSVFDNVAFAFSPQDTNSMSNLSFAFNTVFINGTFSPVVSCTASGTGVTTIENNIIFKLGNQGVQDAINGANCTAHNNLLSPQNAPVASSNIVMNPKLVDPVNHDFRLEMDSAAVDSAVPSNGLEVDIDFAGVARPQGAGPDMGAFERVP